MSMSNREAQCVSFQDSGHVAVVHDDTCTYWNCQFCVGGLFACIRCGSFEGATTTHCPGYQCVGQLDEIYAGKLDYRDGEWVDAASWHTPNRGYQIYANPELKEHYHAAEKMKCTGQHCFLGKDVYEGIPVAEYIKQMPKGFHYSCGREVKRIDANFYICECGLS